MWFLAVDVYKPGNLIKVSGVYKIDHRQHSLVHEATLVKGERFPLCRTCGDKVRFTLLRQVEGETRSFASTDIMEEYPK